MTIRGQLEKLGLENNSMSHKLVQAGDVLSLNSNGFASVPDSL